jgi:hypothetical protein
MTPRNRLLVGILAAMAIVGTLALASRYVPVYDGTEGLRASVCPVHRCILSVTVVPTYQVDEQFDIPGFTEYKDSHWPHSDNVAYRTVGSWGKWKKRASIVYCDQCVQDRKAFSSLSGNDQERLLRDWLTSKQHVQHKPDGDGLKPAP